MMQTLLETLNQNPFFSGGLSLMVVGTAAALLRKVPGQLWTFLQRRLSITVEVPDRDRRSAGSRSGWRPSRMRAAARPEPGDDVGPGRRRERLGRGLRPGRLGGDGPQLAGEVPALPAPGTHLMLYRNRLLILKRSLCATSRTAIPAPSRRTCRSRSWGSWASIEQLLAECGSWRARDPLVSASYGRRTTASSHPRQRGRRAAGWSRHLSGRQDPGRHAGHGIQVCLYWGCYVATTGARRRNEGRGASEDAAVAAPAGAPAQPRLAARIRIMALRRHQHHDG